MSKESGKATPAEDSEPEINKPYAKCLAQPWLSEARIIRPMIEVKRSAGSGFRRSSVDPLMKRGRRPILGAQSLGDRS